MDLALASYHNVINFADRRGGAIYYTAHIVPEGRKHRRWAVIRRAPDGTEELCNLCRQESDARGMASFWRKAEAERQRERNAFVADTLGRVIASMPDRTLEIVAKAIDYERRFRSECSAG
jgi:hypothetical protein